ncbi:MAG: hypothetical protein R2708_05855 [Vicinamibacterales bacterium]
MDGRRDRAAVAAAYTAARDRLLRRLADGARTDARFAAARLTLAGLGVLGALAGYLTGRWPALWGAGTLGPFVLMAVRHARLADALTDARKRLALVNHGLARLQGRWQGMGPDGQAYRTEAHPYADDLDIFGTGGLFDLLSSARTDAGERTLAGWLLRPSAPAEIRARQQAVRELAQRESLREDLAVLGPGLPAAAATSVVEAWASQPVPPPPALGPPVLAALSAASVGGIAWWGVTAHEPAWLGGALAAQAVIGLWRRPRVRASIKAVDRRAHDLTLTAALAARLERETFQSAHLQALQARLSASGAPASVEIRRLARLVDLLTSRQNQIFGPVSVLLFWATQLAWAIDAWRARAGRHVPAWFAALGEFEALGALGTFAAEHPDAVFPVFADGPPRLDGAAVVHPLLPADAAVGNDVALGGDGPHLVIVSGSNMSGKSTYLRAIGVNVVLAQAGAPVCATRFTMTPLLPAGTLRVQDSLQSGRSRFFAEITRLQQIVRLAREASPACLFLIDELLSGTNSHDRQQGAAGVLRGLVDLGAIGLATTHDLAVTALADGFGPRAANVHFADRFEEGGLAFDYRLRPGVVATSNALALMRSVGLDV